MILEAIYEPIFSIYPTAFDRAKAATRHLP